MIKITSSEFKTLKIHETKHNALSISHLLRTYIDPTKNILQILKNNESLQKKLNNILASFINDENRYVYIIYQDNYHNYRYLADGSLNPEDRGFFGQKFFPLQEEKWHRAFKSNKPTIFTQNKINNLWITMLYPLNIFKGVKSFLVIDLSTSAYKNIKNVLYQLRNFLKYLLYFFIGIFILLILLYAFLYTEYRRTFVDALTGVYNRNYLKHIEKIIDLSQYTLAMIDLDNFKAINDNYGHTIGDEAIKKVAKNIAANIRQDDILIRYGGDEFLLFAKKGRDMKNFYNRIYDIINNTIITIPDATQLKTGCSMGVNLLPDRDNTIIEAIKKADIKLYHAKKLGKNRVEYRDQADKNKKILEFDKINHLIHQRNVILYFQPIINMKTKKIEKYEALARLYDGKHIYYPNQFLGTIFQTNTYREFSKIIIQQAFEIIKNYQISISVNFNKSDFIDDAYYDSIKEIIEENQKYRELFILELLENEELKVDDEKILKRIKYFQNLGCKIALDDFGSGYSNFNYLLILEPDIVKIDGSLISQIQQSPNAKKIVQSIIYFTKYMGIETIAEFIENEDIFNIVKNLGIDYGQGYFIGKPCQKLQREPFKIFECIDTNAA
ncbi:bifunctional diguanylate cyclase/phosphodiesterase [Nitratiruptor sp. YY09-18]|uniref:bifunctional diguanylate cyclase/phosphodiesterase n=1 Tax=Nitratiruptor sp. YY09-18 TaxID=2724901 RepID=UPI001915F43E|nr:bifunctional diguanylate cyclase/phosphodiesterase [Nitratiruptor sp. YY09-18]